MTLCGLLATGVLTACGDGAGPGPASSSASRSGSSPRSGPSSTGTPSRSSNAAGRQSPASSARLTVVGRAALPAARTGSAAAAFGTQVVLTGGLSSAGTSTATVFTLPRDGHGPARSAGPLPGPVHDAAQATVGGQLLLFGGGRSEGSDRIIRVLPGPAQVLARLPQPLSDLAAAVIGNVAYVIGGWNGTATNRTIYAFSAGANGSHTLGGVGRLPLGVRYPAAAALGAQLIIAGGEQTSGAPTTAAWSFDPKTGKITPLPSLPAATDHAPGAVLNGRFYVLGGLRRGSFTSAILSWAPGERGWRASGRLPSALSDSTAVSLPNAIAVLGGRNAGGAVADVTWLGAKRR